MNAEARAFVKCIIKHNGKEGCEKCCTRGKHFLGRMVFTNLNAALRTDLSFRNREHPRHHKRNASPLELIGTNMISQFALDGLHLVYLGVFQRWLNFILKERGPFTIDDDTLEALSRDLVNMKPWCPEEFKRKPREQA